MSLHEKLDAIINNLGTGSNGSLPDMAIQISCSGKLHNTTGYLWSYGAATVTIYIINGLPEATSITATSTASWTQNTGYQSATNTATFKLKRIALIDAEKNETLLIYQA